jgi:hypothetical protein
LSRLHKRFPYIFFDVVILDVWRIRTWFGPCDIISSQSCLKISPSLPRIVNPYFLQMILFFIIILWYIKMIL